MVDVLLTGLGDDAFSVCVVACVLCGRLGVL